VKNPLKNLEFKHSLFVTIAVAGGCIAQKLMEAHITGEHFALKFIWVIGVIISFVICILIECAHSQAMRKKEMRGNPLYKYLNNYWIAYPTNMAFNCCIFYVREDFNICVREYDMHQNKVNGKEWHTQEEIIGYYCASWIPDTFFFVVHSPNQSQERSYIEFNPERGELWVTKRDSSERVAIKSTRISPSALIKYRGEFPPKSDDLTDYIAHAAWRDWDKDSEYERVCEQDRKKAPRPNGDVADPPFGFSPVQVEKTPQGKSKESPSQDNTYASVPYE
jgi:hypothetical protein